MSTIYIDNDGGGGVVGSGLQVTQVGNGAITFNSALGDTQLLAANGNISSLNIIGGSQGQMLVLGLQQNAAGDATWPSTIGNALLSEGAFIKTLIGNAVDMFYFAWDVNSSKWLQVSPMSSFIS